jgi:hypothetical protein
MSSNKLRTAGTLLKKVQPLLHIVLKESLDYTGALLEVSARKSLRRLSQQSGVSQSSVEAAKNYFA